MLKYFLEIKNRVFLLVLNCLSTLIVCCFYKETLLFLLVQSSTSITNLNKNLSLFYFIFTNVTEVFLVYVQLITFLCFQMFFIYLVYQCFTFLNLAMFKIESYYLKTFFKLSFITWICSVVLTNAAIIPLTWNFFLSFQELLSAKFVKLHFEAKLNEYLVFYFYTYYVCIFYCQVFTILFFFLNYVNNQSKVIQKFRKLFYYFFVFFSTLISPPDVFSQVFISGFVIFVYELIVFSFLVKTQLIR